MTTLWPADRTDQLLLLNMQGISALAIGKQLGLSKGAVLGKLRRLGVFLQSEEAKMRRLPRFARAALQGVRPSRRKSNHAADAVVPAIDGPATTDARNGVSFFNIVHSQCRFPLTEVTPISDFLFCGEAVAGEWAWCPEHAVVCLNIPKTAAQWRGRPAPRAA